MKLEKRRLIHDLLDDQCDIRREATLLTGGRILRRRRQQRVAIRGLAAMTLLVLVTLSLQRTMAPGLRPAVSNVVPLSPQTVQSLTDADLLALFPDTPVGLVTLENGRKRLIFPRPGDEERFINRL